MASVRTKDRSRYHERGQDQDNEIMQERNKYMTLIERLTSTPEDKRLFEQERVIFEVTELISKLMEEQNVSKADLARMLRTSKANVTQMLDGRRNMTLRSIVDVTFHLNASLCIGAKSLASSQNWYDVSFRVQLREPVSWTVSSRDKTRDQIASSCSVLPTRMAG
jgi:antitoxin component HigA of HigAB toxin-antitoxin module